MHLWKLQPTNRHHKGVQLPVVASGPDMTIKLVQKYVAQIGGIAAGYAAV